MGNLRIQFFGLFLVLLIGLSPFSTSSQAPELPAEDEEIYFGYNWGAAGIVKALIELGTSGILEEESRERIHGIVQKALNGIWSHRLQLDNGSRFSTWEKFENGVIYPGIKYGGSGISKSFLQASSFLSNETWGDLARLVIDETYLQAMDHNQAPHWTYSYPAFDMRGSLGIALTGINFGSFGIVDATLDLFAYTQDPKYLELAKNASHWVRNSSYNATVNGKSDFLIPWYPTTATDNNIFTSYGTGIAGIIPVLDRLYDLTNDSLWLDWANFHVDWLGEIQHNDGIWPSTRYDNDQYTDLGFENGMTGILSTLVDHSVFLETINSAGNYSDYLDRLYETISKGANWLMTQTVQDGQYVHFPITTFDPTIRFDLYNGMAGIANLLNKLVENHVLGTQINDLNDTSASIFEYIISKGLFEYSISTNGTNKQLLGVHPIAGEVAYTDLSYASGLAGYALIVKDLFSSSIDFPSKAMIPEILIQIVDTLYVLQREDGLWKRQVRVTPTFQEPSTTQNQTRVLLTLGIIVMVGVLLRLRKLIRI